MKGQTLMEVVVVSTVGILVVSALTFAVIFSLRNASFAKNQAQATKLAQEGMERIRTGRDRGDLIGNNFVIASGVPAITDWKDSNLWSNSISANCIPNCYFKFSGSNFQYLAASSNIPSNAEDLLGDGRFKRVMILSDSSADCDPTAAVVLCYTVEKNVTAVVQWTDFAGSHESRLTTILRKL